MQPAPRPPCSRRRTRRAMALLPTLLVLSLLLIAVVLFLALSRIQLASARDHFVSYDLRHLQDSAINLAIAQIKDGATQPETLWVSQPGALRTYIASSGQPDKVFKLYSAYEMVEAAATLDSPAAANLAHDVPPDWADHPASFADLNAPSIRADGSISFPIIDPRALDPAGLTTPEGFSFSQDHAASGGAVGGVINSGPPSSLRLPMPVAWIYTLADGSLGTVDTSGSYRPLPGHGSPSRTNPIVGRFAFWTDDESAKVNVNTASEAIFWDTPRCATPEDISYARRPPAKNEVQRFGGHPATTCLSSVLLPGRRLDPSDPSDADELRQIYSMAPRVSASGGLLGGGGAIPFDEDRLYPTIDEFLLDPDHQAQPLFASDPARLARLRFFLTASSDAPELTAAGSPRVCLWPVFWDDLDSHRTSFDRLASFCATLGGRSYFFRRNHANTNMGEFNTIYTDQTSNADIARYLLRQNAAANQGYALSIEDKYDPAGAHLTTGFAHNSGSGVLSFLEFIRQINLHDTSIAASGQRVEPYARPWNEVWIGTQVHGQVTNMAMSHLPEPFAGSSSPSILRGGNLWSNGVGREYVVSEFGLCLILAAHHKASGEKFHPELVDAMNLPPGFKLIQIAPLFEGFCPSQGFTMSSPSASASTRDGSTEFLSFLRITSTLGARAAGGPITSGTTQQARNLWGVLNHNPAHLLFMSKNSSSIGGTPSRDSPAEWWVGWGGSGGYLMYGGTDTTGVVANDAAYADLLKDSRRYPTQYSRGFFLIPEADTSIELSTTRNHAGVPTLFFAGGNQRNGDFAGHKLLLHLPRITLPVPEEPSAGLAPTWGQRYENFSANRFAKAAPYLIDPSDVVRTWVVRHGDHRMVYLREREGWNMPPDERLFTPHPDWDPSGPNAVAARSIRQIHSFTAPGGTPEQGASFHRGIVRGVTYAPHVTPDFTLDPASHPAYAANRPPGYPYALDPTDTRDWDTGTGIAPDGAYWGKVDDVAHQSDGTHPPYFSKFVWDGVVPGALDETTAPNQMVPSAVMFGSIPSAVFSGAQWTTYLFRPDITPGGHLGSAGRTVLGDRPGAPPDHTILDRFWMPVVQPYAISGPFSTAGKVNMNYRIAPFTYIRRATGLHAVLKSERLLAIPTSAGLTYKTYAAASSNTGWRQPIDAATTLLQWEERFDDGRFFLNPSEICEQFLVPENKGITATDTSALREAMQDFWDDHALTGDNVLERPYANLYPRLTTRSNAYRVHFVAQTIEKARSSDPTTFVPGIDTVAGETQGDALVERAIDPNDPLLMTPEYDFIGNPDALSLDTLYTYRIRHIRRFTR